MIKYEMFMHSSTWGGKLQTYRINTGYNLNKTDFLLNKVYMDFKSNGWTQDVIEHSFNKREPFRKGMKRW